MTKVKCRQFKCSHSKLGVCQLESITLQANGPIISKLVCVQAHKKQIKEKKHDK